MRPLFIKAAAAVAFLQGIAHASLILLAKPTHGPAEANVIAVMKGHAFNFSGAERSYWDLYFGYAMLAAAACVVEGLVLLVVARLVRTDALALRRLLLVLLLANIAHALLAARFFFFVPIVADALVAMLLAAALFMKSDAEVGGVGQPPSSTVV